MARPSQNIDEALLRSGLLLYPGLGCAALSVRRVAEHAGVNPAMLHYHFGSKQAFLRSMLQQHYESLFSRLSASGQGQGDALLRLRDTLFLLACFVREHRALIARLLLDAGAGEPVVLEFLQANAPRHLGLVMALLAEARQQGLVRDTPPLQGLSFVMSSVLAPILITSGAAHLRLAPQLSQEQIEPQVLSDPALHERIDWALGALGARPVSVPARSPR